ncbi:Bug family tripartite tricarboxylate transporter substrate binding protein [Agromyces bauzanensis]
MSPKRRILLGFAAGAASILTMAGCGVTNQQSSAADDSEGPFYAGKTITLIVPFDAGGASDTFSRMLAGHLSEYLEGNPEVVVENVPGGAQKEGLNRFARADHESGLHLAMGSGGIIASTLLDAEGIQFDPDDFETLVAFGGGMTIFGSTQAGIGSIEDLTTSAAPVYYGGLELNASESVRVFALDQLGIPDFQPLMGYDGGGSITAAVLSGELSAGNSTSSHYLTNVLPLEEDGEITPLMTQGYVIDGEVVRDPALPDLPTMPEAYEELTGERAEGAGWDIYRALTTAQTNLLRNYWVHADAPEEAKAELHEAIAQVVEDEDFLREAGELLGEEPLVQLGEEADVSMAAVRDLSAEQVQWIKDFIAETSVR